MVPGTGIFGLPDLDKLVHIFLFGTHVLLWGWHYGQRGRRANELRQIILIDVLVTIALGVGLEYVQRDFIPNRSFDGGDILADVVGALVAGIWLMWRTNKTA